MTDSTEGTDESAEVTPTEPVPEEAESLTIALVAAIAENGVIGRNGEMPWHYPADLRHFKQTTTGHPIIMGRRTYESIADRIGGPLPDRTNIVLSSRDREYDDAVHVVSSVADALSAAGEAVSSGDETVSSGDKTVSSGDKTVYVIGGESVYEQFLPLADRLVITEIPESPEGDTRFPDWTRDRWELAERESDGELTFVTYRRR